MAMELEGRRTSDNAWYHCRISICSNGRRNVLKVQFSEGGVEYIRTPKEAQSKLRPASKCLEKGECRKLQVGDRVLVSSSSLELGKSGFFEVLIKGISRHQHSSGDTCNCKLDVLSVGAKNQESCTVLASQVRLLDLSSSLNDNPTFCDWVGGGTTHGSDRLDTSDAESDMHAQLDEQINKITMLTETFKETSSSTTQLLAGVSTQTRRTRRTRSLPTYVENKTKLRKDSSLYKCTSLDKQPRLSPLAARAALAATVPTDPVKQLILPHTPESKVLSMPAGNYTPETGPVRAARNPPRRCRLDRKAKR